MLFRFNDVKKSYGGNEILRGVSFQVNPGEKIGLVGRNGAGKTTMFRLITGVETADEGSVEKSNQLSFGLLDQHVDFESGETVHTAALSAFKHVHDIEAEMRRLEILMETDHSDEILSKYADLQIAFERADGFTYAARAESVLLGIGFGPEMWNTPAITLSGGQRNRLGMARLLLSNADVLLLDEPTNHLDVDAVKWLEEYLKTYERAYVIISHDRYFLDRAAERIIEIENGKAVSYKGNYSTFLVERELRREQQKREYENQQAMIAKTQDFIRRNLEGQKTKQAKSRRNMLERMERLDAVKSERSGGNFKLKDVERTGNNVLTTEDLVIGYGKTVLARGINIILHRGDVLGVIGGNGTGKTTLLKTLLGQIPELDGRVLWGTKTNIGYYSQTLDDLYDGNDVIGELRRVAPMVENVELRSFLARFLFVGEDIEKKVGDLSGGEKGRLALAKLIYSRKNVLILDEPTNHLDIPAREALESALDEYPGTIVTVSHDRFFLDRIATQIISFENDETVLDFHGNYSEFDQWKSAKESESSASTNRISKEGRVTSEKGCDVARVNRSGANRPSDSELLSKNQRAQIENRIRAIEKKISSLESGASLLANEIARPDGFADFSELTDLNAKLSENQNRTEELYSEWDGLTRKLARS